MSLRREVVSQDEHRISYLVEGAGPVVVMLPAMLQSASRWEALGYVERFSDRYRVIVIDLLGRGESDRPYDPAAYGPESLVASVSAVLAGEGARQAALWGFAGGAEVAGLVARRRPALVRAAVFGGLYLGDVIGGLRDVGVDAEALIERCAEALERGDWDEYFKTVPVDIPAHLQSSYAETNDPLAIAAITRAELLRHRTFLVPPVPTLAYWAEGDSFAGQNSRLSESMPIESAVIPGGHADAFLNVERVAAEVDPFLSAHFTQGR